MDFGAETQRLNEHITDEHHNTAVKTHRTFQYRLSHDVIEGLCLAMYKFIIIYNKIVVNSLSLHIPGVPYQCKVFTTGGIVHRRSMCISCTLPDYSLSL